MEFRNHTPFPALAFEGINQVNQPFHVLTLRQTLTWDDDGVLIYADEQLPLNMEDRYVDKIGNSAVSQESDLCHYKPFCDVIVNATAYSPKSVATRQFDVRLRLTRPAKVDLQSLPKPPKDMNPLQKPSTGAQYAWAEQYKKALSARLTDTLLLDKTLKVLGERWFVRRLWPRRLLASLIRWISLGAIRLSTWRLTKPRKTASVPVRADLAFGGQCRIEIADKCAKKIAKRHQLKSELRNEFPDCIAVDGMISNPVGCGWIRNWYLKAKKIKRLSAPQIELPGRPVKIDHFMQALYGKLKERTEISLVAGLGIRHKGHPARSRLVGTVDDDFINGDTWLPKDFDFSVWNAAWPDQQTPHLFGDETIELTNLCKPDSLGVRYDKHGNTCLRLKLPRHDCFALVRFNSGEMEELSLAIDTVIIEPETQTLSLVWRQVMTKDLANPIRVTEARMRTFAEREAQRMAGAALQTITQQAGVS
jgi:hypothetical protein